MNRIENASVLMSHNWLNPADQTVIKTTLGYEQVAVDLTANLVKNETEVKPGRPTIAHHRHPDDTMRKHYDKNTTELKTKMNYLTIVAGEQQTELLYKSHEFMYSDGLVRQLYSEIADVEEQHVLKYGLLGDSNETMLEKLELMQLCEAYIYFSCAQTETTPE